MGNVRLITLDWMYHIPTRRVDEGSHPNTVRGTCEWIVLWSKLQRPLLGALAYVSTTTRGGDPFGAGDTPTRAEGGSCRPGGGSCRLGGGSSSTFVFVPQLTPPV